MTKTDIENALQQYRLEYHKAKEAYGIHINPEDKLIIEKARIETFHAKILEQEMKNILALILIANSFLQDEVQK